MRQQLVPCLSARHSEVRGGGADHEVAAMAKLTATYVGYAINETSNLLWTAQRPMIYHSLYQ